MIAKKGSKEESGMDDYAFQVNGSKEFVSVV